MGAEPSRGSAQPCEQPGPLMEANVAVVLVAFAGALILVLLCAVLLLCYRLRWAHSGSLQYLSFHHSARYTLKEPSQPAPPPPSLPPTIPLPPQPPLPSRPTPSPPFHPAPQPPRPALPPAQPPFHPAPPPSHPAPPPFRPAPPVFQPTPPLIHTTPPSPLLPPADMVVYSRIGHMRTSRPPSATQVILFEHSSL
ncbi:hypothetical protein AAFF_G00372370 [Aldrovandia affinis]|uniref:Uncharacterized protein n=1 Tax=Aldrovandia affinis TaxID=143900 RepID=A0AAD7SGC3_9TELE|nr:hypothetical protein AAFF_G00372370 [Aldrovandia affinis]